MKQYRCIECASRCTASAPDRPSQCLFEKDSKSPKWELIEQPVRNNYATIPRPSAPAIDWKKAFEMLRDLAKQDKDGRIKYIDTAIKVILSKCTEGGE